MRASLAAFFVLAAVAISRPLVEQWAPVGPGAGADPAPAHRYAPPAEAVQALRAGECDRALAAIEPASPDARVVAALYAHACGAHGSALQRLRSSADYTGPLADWRLWALGESAGVLGQPETAQQAFTALAGEFPASPLAGLATAAAAEVALERGDHAAIEGLVAAGRAAALSGETGARLEKVAWSAATQRGDPEARRESARRLLVEHPLTAAELEVIDIFRAADGTRSTGPACSIPSSSCAAPAAFSPPISLLPPSNRSTGCRRRRATRNGGCCAPKP